MPHDFTVQSVAALDVRGISPIEQSVKTVVPVASVLAAQPVANPTVRLDPTLGLVVIEFHDDSGKLVISIPSQTQLAAYRERGSRNADANTRDWLA
jgi:hypothetical protein